MNRRMGFSILLTVLVLGVCLAFLGKPSAASGLDWRISTTEFTQNPCPVEIIKLTRADGKPLALNEDFRSTVEALSGASVTVRNASDKGIKQASLVFFLVDAQTNYPKAKSTHPLMLKDVATAATAETRIDGELIQQLQRLSQRSGIPLTQLRLGVDWAELSDATRWMLGTTLVRSVDRPERWYPKGSPLIGQRSSVGESNATFVSAKSNAGNAGAALWCECCHLGYVDFLPCSPEETICRFYEAAWQNWWSSPFDPGTYNIDTVLVECAPGCYSYPYTWVSNCIP